MSYWMYPIASLGLAILFFVTHLFVFLVIQVALLAVQMWQFYKERRRLR